MKSIFSVSKITLIVVLVSMTISFNLKAQFNTGPKLGLNANKLVTNIDSLKSDDFKAGLVAGWFFTFGKDKWTFQPEILISQKKGTFNYGQINSMTNLPDTSFFANSFYLDIPLMIGYRPFKPIRIQTGPVVSNLLSEKIKMVVNDTASPLSLSNQAYHNWNLSWQFGAQIDISKIMFSVRYNFLMGKVFNQFDIPKYNLHFTPESTSSMFQCTLGFKLVPISK